MSEKHLERKVGFFVLSGLIVCALLIISFGNFEHFLKKNYIVNVKFANASGIIRHSQVLYRGAKVGTAITSPIIEDAGDSVQLKLRIDGNVRIPKNAEFKIGTYGMLGDRFVDIIPPKDASTDYFKDGDVAMGSTNKGIAEFLAEAEDKLQKFDAIIADIKTKIITDEFIKNFHGSVENARELLERGNKLMGEAENGKGPLYTVLKDKETAANLKQFIYNLRKTGPFFYSDLTGKEEEDKKADKATSVSRPRR